MASEIRANSITSRAGLSTVTMTDSGPMFSGITTFVDNSGFTFGVGGGTSIFTPATNVLTFGTNNTEKIRIDASGHMHGVGVITATHFYGDVTGNTSGGTVAGSTGTFTGDLTIADSIVHAGDTHTKIRFPANDQFTVETAGTERLKLDRSADQSHLYVIGDDTGMGARVFLQNKNTTSGAMSSVECLDNGGQAVSGIKFHINDHSNNEGYMTMFTRPSGGTTLERLRIASNGKIYIKGNGGDSSTDFSDAGTFFNLKHDTYGGRIGFSNGTASAGVTIAEVLGYWGSNKVAGWIMTAGGDATNRDDGEMSFYTRESGQGMFERLHIGSEGEVVAGYRVGTSSVRSNQPVAFHSARVTPDTASSTLSNGVRCNLYVGSNTGWAAGDGGVIGMGGSRSGNAGQEAMWAYIKGSRISGNGWEYAGKMELGTTEWGTYNTTKAVTIYADNQIDHHGKDNTMYSASIGGAVRVRLQHNGGGNMTLSNPSSGNFTFDTNSDYRLKENVVNITNALTTVKALKPYQYKWKHDGKLGQGFIAHEAQEVLPDVGIVSGAKDAVHTEDDPEKGHWKKDDPIYQGIDYSKLVPLLTAALQELNTKVETLEQENITLRARVTNLEGE